LNRRDKNVDKKHELCKFNDRLSIMNMATHNKAYGRHCHHWKILCADQFPNAPKPNGSKYEILHTKF
jgi:hypothetical protein